MLPLKVEFLSRIKGLKLDSKKSNRITPSMLQCLFAKELFLAPLICQEVEVVFCIVLSGDQ